MVDNKKITLEIFKKKLTNHQSILISGGDTINKLFHHIDLSKHDLYLSDERIDQKFSLLNYLTKIYKVQSYCNHQGAFDPKLEQKYLNLKLAVLGVGHDSHICSLFQEHTYCKINDFSDITYGGNPKTIRWTVNYDFLAQLEIILIIQNERLPNINFDLFTNLKYNVLLI